MIIRIRETRYSKIDNLLRNELYQNCLNCLHWKETDDLCGLYKEIPPPKIIVAGCETYRDIDDIPYCDIDDIPY